LQITVDPSLRKAFKIVWARLPRWARAYIDEIQPAIFAVSANELRSVTPDATASATTSLVVRGDRVAHQIFVVRGRRLCEKVALLAHELAHLVLHHDDVALLVDDAAERAVLSAYFEDQANFLLARWGFERQLSFLRPPRWWEPAERREAILRLKTVPGNSLPKAGGV